MFKVIMNERSTVKKKKKRKKKQPKVLCLLKDCLQIWKLI